MGKSNRVGLLSSFGILVVLATIIYNIYDNNRVKVVEEEVYIETLPNSFDGFKILQISDLHYKYFGKGQERLLKIINSLDFDMVAITGDMGSKHTDDISPFIDLIDGIEDKENMFYIVGNNGPEALTDHVDGSVTEIGRILEEKGLNVLLKPYAIKSGDDTLWVTRLLGKEDFYKDVPRGSEDDIKVVLSHYPFDGGLYEDIGEKSLPNYNLVLAGHYHGGQYRIPGIGALFVPNVNGGEIFPSKSMTSGLNTWGNYNQYVTRGLGASSKFKFLEFRLFNTPEINMITLKSE